jgi:hypothetical protein
MLPRETHGGPRKRYRISVRLVQIPRVSFMQRSANPLRGRRRIRSATARRAPASQNKIQAASSPAQAKSPATASLGVTAAPSGLAKADGVGLRVTLLLRFR